MCPLRIILIFLSASLAGFFALRNFKSHSIISSATDTPAASDDSPVSDATSGRRSSSKVKVCGCELPFLCTVRTRVDMNLHYAQLLLYFQRNA